MSWGVLPWVYPVWDSLGFLDFCHYYIAHVTSEAVPFVHLASVCRSLQCQISTLTHVGGCGLLFRFASSVVLWGGRGTADKYHCRVWGVPAVFRPHWVCPCSHVCFPCLHCPGSSLLFSEQALSCVHFSCLSCSGSGSWVIHKGPDSIGPVFCALPIRAAQITKSLKSLLYLGASCLFPSVVPTSLFGHAGKVHLVSLLGS